MKFLITGVNGFIGSNLAERLIGDGHSVRGLVRKTGSLDYLKNIPVELVYGDVTDAESVSSAMKGIDIVVHVAGFASDWGSYQQFYQVNVIGTQNVLESALSNKVKRVVHISTTAIHGFPGFRFATEETPFARTIWPYCETKKIAETWVMEFSKKTGLPVSVIRPGNVFGVKDHTFFEKYADALLKGQVGYINGGKSWTCPTYIENLVEGIVRACFEPNAVGGVFIITDGLEITWHSFTEKVADALGVKRPGYSIPFWLGYTLAMVMEWVYDLFKIKNAPLLTRYRISNGGRDYHFSIERAKQRIGYRPPVGLEEAIHRSAEWYMKQKKKLTK
jgi:nucleoside-diphosphate-sugar epimerase